MTLTSITQDAHGVTATFDYGDTVRARYAVGADGIHSTVREQAAIGFRGGQYDESFTLADVRLRGEAPVDEVILFWATAGLTVVAPLPDGVHRIVAPVADAPEAPSAQFIQRAARHPRPGPRADGRDGPDVGLHASESTTGWPTRIGQAGCCWPATPRTCTARPAGRA